MKLSLLAAALLAFAPAFNLASATADLAGYRTVKTAATVQVSPARAAATGLAGYLGVDFDLDKRGQLVAAEVAADSPAAQAGVQPGDGLSRFDGKSPKSADAMRELIQARAPGDVVKLTVQRGRKAIDLSVTLGAVSRPLASGADRAILGVRMGTPTDAGGIPIVSVTTNKPAAKAGLRTGDVILRVDGAELGEAVSLTDKLSEKRPGDRVKLVVRRGKSEFEKTIELESDDTDTLLPEERRTLTPWKKPAYRLAVLLVEFPDTKHNELLPVAEWERAYFSRDTYNTTNATGQRAYGSMADYYHEISCGKLKVEGRVFDWVTVEKERAKYDVGRTSTARGSFFSNIVSAVEARDGKGVLKDFDGLAVVYAGERFPGANRGSMLWAHRFNVTLKGKSWPYVIVAEGGKRMSSISTMCHETGHILGLPDLYARPENPGSEGAGTWCAMSNQSPNGRPQHFSAWSKEQLGWLTPTVIDPSVKQKLILGPVEGSTNECFKVLVRPDGGEYFLLENRRKQGFDASLSAEGLLIWRVVANRPILEESHGVEGPTGPRVFLPSVPFPSKANHSFTPHTTPSSKPQMAGGAPVHITNIRQLPDGRVAFHIGYEFE